RHERPRSPVYRPGPARGYQLQQWPQLYLHQKGGCEPGVRRLVPRQPGKNLPPENGQAVRIRRLAEAGSGRGQGSENRGARSVTTARLNRLIKAYRIAKALIGDANRGLAIPGTVFR